MSYALKRLAPIVLTTFATLFLSLSHSSQSFAAPYLSSDLLGQITAEDAADFDKNNPDNGNDNYKRGLNSPHSVNLDTVHHRLFVTDTGNNRVLVFNLNKEDQLEDRVADNVLGQVDFNNSWNQTSQNGLNFPTGIAYDSNADRLFVTDQSNQRIMVWDTATIENGEDAINVLGQTDFNNNFWGLAQDKFQNPVELAFDMNNKRLFVSDGANNRVLVFDVSDITDGEKAINVLGQIDFVSNSQDLTPSNTNQAFGLAYDHSKNLLYVTDQLNNRVLVFDVTDIGDGEKAINVLGQPDFKSNTAATTQNSFNVPKSLALDEVGQRLFVLDSFNQRNMVFDVSSLKDGQDAVNVLGQPDFVSSTTGTTQANLNFPLGINFNPTANLVYVSDNANNRILIFDATTIKDGEEAADVLGQVDANDKPVFTTGSPMNAENATITNEKGLGEPRTTLIDPVGHRLFVTDTKNNRVLIFDLDGSNNLLDHSADHVLGQMDFTSSKGDVSQNRMIAPTGLALDFNTQRLFVSDFDNNRILVFDVTDIKDGEDAVNVLGQPDFVTSTPNITQNGLTSPAGLFYDVTNQRLFVGDAFNNRVLMFDVTEIKDGEDAVHVLGQPDFVTNTQTTTQNGMAVPGAVLFDANRNLLFVGEYLNSRILVFDLTEIKDGEDAVHVLGQPDFVTSAQTTTQNGMGSPLGLALDPNTQILFVSELFNSRLLTIDTSEITDSESAVNVLGQADFVSSLSSVGQSNFSQPFAISLLSDADTKRLYVTDMENHRVMIFDFIRITTTSVSEGTKDKPYEVSIATKGGQGTVSFALQSGTLPNGLSLDAVTGTISGTPTVAGKYSFTIRALDNGDSGAFVDDQAYDMTIAAIPANKPKGGGGGGGGGGKEEDIVPSLVETPLKAETPLEAVEPVFSEENCAGFTDVKIDDPDCHILEYVKSTGVMTGHADGHFGKYESVKRDQMAKISLLTFHLFEPAVDYCAQTEGFPDVKPLDWSYQYVCRGKALKMITGYLDEGRKGFFLPEYTLNRAEMLALVLRNISEPMPSNQTLSYEDVSEDLWYSGLAAYAKANNLFEGEKLHPEQEVSRIEIAQTLFKLNTLGEI